MTTPRGLRRFGDRAPRGVAGRKREKMVGPHDAMDAMTLHDFAKMTLAVISEDGLDGYLPTFILPDIPEIRAIQGIPADVDHRDAVQNVVRRSGYEKREFFFGVQSAPRQITIGHCRPGQPTEFMEITQTPDGCSTAALDSCDWWRVT